MKSLLRNIPNAVTAGNLACGLIAIERILNGELLVAFCFIIAAAILDFFDGFLARKMGVDGALGKQLDSLADLVTFGVAPGLICYHYIMHYGYCPNTGICTSRYAWMFIPLCAAWRLAVFNIDSRQTTGFFGVPTPITGITFASLVLSLEPINGVDSGIFQPLYSNYYFLKLAPIIAGALMVSELPMLALKFKKGDPLNVWKWALIGLLIVVTAIFQRDAGIPILISYVLISLLANFATKRTKNG